MPIDRPPFRVGLIGCGLRGIWYLHTFKQAQVPIRLTAAADPDLRYAQIASRQFADGHAAIFSNGSQLLDSGNLDAVIIASPNHVHRDDAVKAMRLGIPFLLEKPVAASLDDLSQIWQGRVQTGHEPIIGFCLRYTPFYASVKAICESGKLGQILAVNAEELMSDDLSLVFARGDWRPDPEKSGGLMSEKCSHDMDILNWIAGAPADSVSSLARRTFLTPRQGAAARCRDCSLRSHCRFAHGSLPEIFEAHWPRELHDVLQKLEDDTCVFDARHTYPDHQTLTASFSNGVLANFTVAQCQPATRRTIHVLGSEARLYGVINNNRIDVHYRGKLGTERVETTIVTPDNSGHNGGDSVLTHDFLALLEGRRSPARPGLREGIEASLLSLAADRSAAGGGQPVRLEMLRRTVFASASEASLVASPR